MRFAKGEEENFQQRYRCNANCKGPVNTYHRPVSVPSDS
jgi:hypothetical protein